MDRRGMEGRANTWMEGRQIEEGGKKMKIHFLRENFRNGTQHPGQELLLLFSHVSLVATSTHFPRRQLFQTFAQSPSRTVLQGPPWTGQRARVRPRLPTGGDRPLPSARIQHRGACCGRFPTTQPPASHPLEGETRGPGAETTARGRPWGRLGQEQSPASPRTPGPGRVGL